MSLFRFGPGPVEEWGAEGAPSDFSGIEKRTHEEREKDKLFLFYNSLPLRFLKLPPVLFVVVRFLPTATLDIRLDLNLRSSIHKLFIFFAYIIKNE